jgi:hypothetical protein
VQLPLWVEIRLDRPRLAPSDQRLGQECRFLVCGVLRGLGLIGPSQLR